MESLGERLADYAAHLDAAMHRFLSDLREFDLGEGWAYQSAQTCAHWLAWRLGMDRATAREQLRVAHRLAELPLVDDALRRGALSYSKVRAITRVANPATEAMLLGMAELMTASQLEMVCRKFRDIQRGPRDPGEEAELRYLTRRDRDDGMVQVVAMLRPDEATRLLGVLDTIAAERTPDVSAETAVSSASGPIRPIRGRRFDRVDALMELAESRARADQPDRTPVELVVAVTAAALANDPAVELLDRTGVLGDGTWLPIATVRQLACDAGVVVIVEDDAGKPLSVGRKHRTVTTALKRALARRDPHCQFPGCPNRIFMEAHHIHHWIDGGTTDLENLVNLCTHHHQMLHEHNFTVVAGSPPRFFDELGRSIQHVPPRPVVANLGWPAIRAANTGLDIGEDTNRCRWDGHSVDHEEVIAELCWAEDHAPAETLDACCPSGLTG